MSYRKATALVAALACHGTFLVAVTAMALALYGGMSVGRGPLTGPAAGCANLLLLAQFPLLHSWLMTRRGRKVLARLAPAPFARTLGPTTFATLASLQLLATFTLWSPSGVVLWEATGPARAAFATAFGLSWLFLLKALADAGLGLQTGSIGWRALWAGSPPRYPGLPRRGLFRFSRQPIYLGFALLLWTGPVWTADHLTIALTWGGYCLLGPRLKERRFLRAHGAAFEEYRRATPYFLPLPRRRPAA